MDKFIRKNFECKIHFSYEKTYKYVLIIKNFIQNVNEMDIYIFKFIYYRKKAKIINDNYVLFSKMKDFFYIM